jgi:lipopolysaccharide export LptBFGC system permease protein LptF
VDPARRALYGVLIGSVTEAELEVLVSSPEASVDLDTESGTLVLTLQGGTMNSLGGDRLSDARFDQAKAHLDVRYRLQRLTRGTNEWKAFSTSGLLERAREVRALPETRENRYFRRRLGRMYREWNERFSVPAICLAIPLVAVPLALVTRTGRRSAAFVASMLLIFLYYLLISLGKSMVSESFISAMIGSWFPVLVLLAVGVGLTVVQVRR